MVGALPKELAALGHDVRVVSPLHGSTKRVGQWTMREKPLGVEVGPDTRWAAVWESTLPGTVVPAYFIEHDWYFARPEVYSEAPDNAFRFAFLCRASLTLCLQLDWIPDVIHCHDWTTGLVPVLLNTTLRDSALGRCATVFTIHNLEHQGYAPRSLVDFTRLPWSEFHSHSLESLGGVNMMKAGLYHSTKLTTVSPTYAQEIRTPGGGCGLDGLLRFRGADLVGILNGIDEPAWDPATDKTLPAPFSASDLSGKAMCKQALQTRLGLEVDPAVPLVGIVARFARQKGLDLVTDAMSEIMTSTRAQIAVLGSGDASVEAGFRWAAAAFPGRVGVHIGFDGKLARVIQAGSDFFLMPSRAEPCGLTQMYAMRYGSLPIVRATGGLVDTVPDWAQEDGTGFVFDHADAKAVAWAVGRANAAFYDDSARFRAAQVRAMGRDFSWGQSAARYVDVYRWAVASRTGTSV